MIKITAANGEHRLFKDHHQVCDYINTLEKQKTLEPEAKGWRFIRRRYEVLSLLRYRNPSLRDFLTPKEKEAIDKRVGLIEIAKGNKKHITQLLFTGRLDIEPLKRDWCKEYCIEHGLTHSEFVVKELD